jgi:replicative DNA helicase
MHHLEAVHCPEGSSEIEFCSRSALRAPIFIDDTPVLLSLNCGQRSEGSKRQHGLKLIIIDYLQLMVHHRRLRAGSRKFHRFHGRSRRCCKRLDVPVIAFLTFPCSRTANRQPSSQLSTSESRSHRAGCRQCYCSFIAMKCIIKRMKTQRKSRDYYW